MILDGCPARDRTWVEGFKVLSATSTPPGTYIALIEYKSYQRLHLRSSLNV